MFNRNTLDFGHDMRGESGRKTCQIMHPPKPFQTALKEFLVCFWSAQTRGVFVQAEQSNDTREGWEGALRDVFLHSCIPPSCGVV